jgi:hypothetical protein
MKKRAVPQPAINLKREAQIVRRLEERVERSSKRLLADIVELGKHLKKVKDYVGHGKFLTWLRKISGGVWPRPSGPSA